jgi:hypothetical protein
MGGTEMKRNVLGFATLVLLATGAMAGTAAAEESRKCIYPQGGLAPAVGPWPCSPKRPHLVEIDHRATFRPDPLSRHSNRTNFGQGRDQRPVGYAAAGASDVLASSGSSALTEYWTEEIEAP